jgi:pimeloyl-ACP methyl ester carboxylesterase
MRRFLSLFACFLCLPTLVLAGSPVDSNLETISAGFPRIMGSLDIPVGHTLVVEAGAQLLFTPGAILSIEGTLKVEGSAAKPIVFAPLDETGSWMGIRSSCDAHISVHHALIKGADDGARICGSSLSVGNVAFSNGLRPRLVLGSPDSVYSQEFHLEHISFGTSLIGNRVQELGIRFEGHWTSIAIGWVTFPRWSRIPEALRPNTLMVSGIARTTQWNFVTYGSDCLPTFYPNNSGIITLGPQPSSCPEKPRPVVFVPGYGSSINFGALSEPETDGSSSSNWHFSRLLTPQYYTLFSWLTANNIPYKVAYYDWRQTADQNAFLYLKPAIDALKSETGSEAVDIVAHSFGGLVSRAYIQGLAYEGDVDSLIQLCTPNAGSAKAYGVWEGGVLPSDWSALNNLIRLYQYEKRATPMTSVQVVRSYFRSVRELLPTEPFLMDSLGARMLGQKNTFLTNLNAHLSDLTARTSVTTIAGSGFETVQTLQVGPPGIGNWEDGVPLPKQPPTTNAGDGTVTTASVEAIPGQYLHENASHLDLVALAAADVVRALRPNMELLTPRAESNTSRATQNALWFAFDCPVEVTITSPSGASYASDSPTDAFEVERSSQAMWLIVPRELGTYTLSIRAMGASEVRWWADDGPISVREMAMGETWQTAHIVSAVITEEPQPPEIQQAPSLPVDTAPAPHRQSSITASVHGASPRPPLGLVLEVSSNAIQPVSQEPEKEIPFLPCLLIVLGLICLGVSARRWPP